MFVQVICLPVLPQEGTETPDLLPCPDLSICVDTSVLVTSPSLTIIREQVFQRSDSGWKERMLAKFSTTGLGNARRPNNLVCGKKNGYYLIESM